LPWQALQASVRWAMVSSKRGAAKTLPARASSAHRAYLTG
jgi:hypothetical protein